MRQISNLCAVILLTISLFINIAFANENHVVGQKNKAFTVEKLTVKKGDTVEFLNEDPFFHNVFSLSDAALFDLGSFPQGESKQVVFDEVGEVEVECAIHPNMMMTIVVEEEQ